MAFMTGKVSRIASILLAFTTAVIFIAEINSPRNDATYIAQATFVIALISAGLGRRNKKIESV